MTSIKKYLIGVILTTLLLLVISSCGNDQHHLGEMSKIEPSDRNQTKLVKSGNLHIAFDLMDMAYHTQMMKLMNVDMKHVSGATHGLMITVMDYKTKKVIQHAEVRLAVTTPGNNQTEYQTEVMHGSGMHHYAIHLKATEAGVYKIKANILTKGKAYQAQTKFRL